MVSGRRLTKFDHDLHIPVAFFNGFVYKDALGVQHLIHFGVARKVLQILP